MAQQHANDAALRAHPETFRTGVVRPGYDGVPELVTTSSSNVHAVGFADDALFVMFQGGKVYRYTAKEHPAPAEPVNIRALHAGFMVAASKGSYFSKMIRTNTGIECVYIGTCTDPVAPADFCMACGAGIPPKPGEGTCQHCNPGVPDNPAEREQHENGDGC